MNTHVSGVIGGSSCGARRAPTSCDEGEGAHCVWPPPGGLCDATPLAHDALSLPFLLSIQSALDRSATRLNEALSAYPGPACAAAVEDVCATILEIRSSARDGRQLASMLGPGFVGPADFDPVLTDANDLRADLHCP
jgi:hypothetical protein